MSNSWHKCPICKNHFGTESGLRSHMVFKKNHIEELVIERDSLLAEVNHLNLVVLLWRDRAKQKGAVDGLVS